MTYTPVELRHVRVGRRPFGYNRAGVEQILSDVADSFETVWRDRGELADKVEPLEQALEKAKEREQLLTNTLVAAEHAAEEMRERARREAELIVSEAHAEARSVMHPARPSASGCWPRCGGSRRCCARRSRSSARRPPSEEAPAEQPSHRRRRREPEVQEEARELRPIAPPRRSAAHARSARAAEPVADEQAPASRRTSCPAGRRCGASRRAARTSTGAINAGSATRLTGVTASTRLQLRVSPGASRAGIVGRHGEAWKVRVAAAARGRPRERRGGAAARRDARAAAAGRRDRLRPRRARQGRQPRRHRAGRGRAAARCRGAHRGAQRGRMSAIDTESFRPLLEQERERIVSQIAHLHEENSRAWRTRSASSRAADGQPSRRHGVGHVRPRAGRGARGGRQQTLAQIDRAIAKLDDGTYGTCERCGNEIGEERLRARPWALLCIDDQRLVDRERSTCDDRAAARAGVAEATPDVRVGSSTNALAPVSVAERSLGAGAMAVGGACAVAAAAVVGDQLTKHVVTSELAPRRVGDGRGAVRDPPRAELRASRSGSSRRRRRS